MNPGGSILLRRDCEAVLIPSGETIRLHAGLPVTLLHSQGGGHTVSTHGRLARIAEKDTDALGLPPPAPATTAPGDGPGLATGPVSEQVLWDQLRTCYDPEIPVNIVELGLIYDLRIVSQPGGGNLVEVKMTLTAPGCGMGAMIAQDVQNKLLSVPGVTEAKVELVFDPPWNPGLMSEAAKLELGIV